MFNWSATVHQKTPEDQESNDDDTSEPRLVANQDPRKIMFAELRYYFITSCRKTMKAAQYQH